MANETAVDRVLEMLRARIAKAGSLRKCATSLGVSPAYLCDVMLRRREPGKSILKPLGVKKLAHRHVEYVYDFTFYTKPRKASR